MVLLLEIFHVTILYSTQTIECDNIWCAWNC